MKRCATCSRVYDEDNLRFCLDDGTPLEEKLANTVASPTQILPDSQNNVATMKAFAPGAPAFEDAQPQSGSRAVSKKRGLVPWLLAGLVLLLVGAGAVVSAFLIYRARSPLVWHLTLEVDRNTPDRDRKVTQTVLVIQRRLDALGVRNEVSQLTDGKIKVSLPALSDPERVKALIINQGKLELVHVVSPPSPAPVQTYATSDEALATVSGGGKSAANRRVLPFLERDDPSTPTSKWVVVELPAIVDGSELRDASAIRTSEDEEYYQIAFSLRASGAEKFGAWTGSHINEYIGVVLNDQVKSVAFIKSQIYDQGEITGNFSRQAAEDLALTLNSGALPAPVTLISEEVNK